jgi:hypothetical protein
MKVFTNIILGSFILFSQFAKAQESDSAVAAGKALFYADSLVKCYFYQDWKSYMDFTAPTAIKYYGGKEGFKEHVTVIYFRNEPKQQERPESIRMLSLRNEIDQWQCVIEKVRNTFIDDKQAVVYSYLVGQSLDNGVNWKFVDVSHNTMENLPFVLPTVFSDLTIPQGKTIYPGDVAAQPVEEAPKATPKKKAVAKKR